MAAAFSESSESELRLGLMTSSTVTCLDVEQPQGVAPADTDQSAVQMQDMSPLGNELLEIQDTVPHVEGHPPQQQPSELSDEQSVDMSQPPDDALMEMQDVVSSVGDHPPEQQSAGPLRERTVIGGIEMSPPPDNTLTEMQDVVSPVEDHPPEQQVRPPGEQSVVQGAATQSKSAVVPTPPEHESELKYISKYLVQYVPVKAKKPPASGRVTGARILTSEECAQLIFECERKRKRRKKQGRLPENRRKRRKKKQLGKKAELTEKRREETAKRKEEAAKKEKKLLKGKKLLKRKKRLLKEKKKLQGRKQNKYLSPTKGGTVPWERGHQTLKNMTMIMMMMMMMMMMRRRRRRK